MGSKEDEVSSEEEMELGGEVREKMREDKKDASGKETKVKETNAKAVQDLMAGGYSDDDDDDDDELFGDDDDDEDEDRTLEKKQADEKAAKRRNVKSLDDDEEEDSDMDKRKKGRGMDKMDSDSEDDLEKPSKKIALSGDSDDDDDDEGAPGAVGRHMKFPSSIQIPPTRKLNKKEEIRLVKIPNFVHLEPRCYDASMYSEKRESQRLENIGKEYVADNIIRWRFKKDSDGNTVKDADGNPEMESNGRFIQWSDGSMQLLIGEEVFDVQANNLQNHFAFSMTSDTSLGRRCLEGQGYVKQSLQFRPTSLSSAVHRDMELKVKAKMLKSVKVKTMTVTQDPVMEQDARMRATEARLRLEQRQRAREIASKRRQPGFNEEFLSEGMDGKSRTKNSRGRKTSTSDDVVGDSELSSSESEREILKKKRKEASKKKQQDSESEEDDDDEEEDGDDDDDDGDDDEGKGEEEEAKSGNGKQKEKEESKISKSAGEDKGETDGKKESTTNATTVVVRGVEDDEEDKVDSGKAPRKKAKVVDSDSDSD